MSLPSITSSPTPPSSTTSVRRRKEWAVLSALAGALAPLAHAQGPSLSHGRPLRPPRVYQVPSESPTIQGAIERALDGDVVVVAPGTYRERIDFLGKAIEVLGTEGPARTILRSPGSSPVVVFRNGEGTDSRLMGFTITGGTGDYEGPGGGVSCVAYGPVASPYLSDCIIERNSTDLLDGTGGAAGIHGNAVLERCILRQNSNYGFAGGAVHGTVTMRQCVIEDSWSCDAGGGLHLLPGSRVEECIVRRNSVGPCSYHGIVYQALGGGVWAEAGPVELVASVLMENWVDEFPEPGIPGDCYGFNQGGALVAGGGITLRACTLVGNHVVQCAVTGGILGAPTLVDCIVQGNEDAPGFYAARSTFRFSNVQGGAAGPGCFDADPLFVDRGAGDLRLREGSPCIDAGDPASPLDPDGTRADLGAFHHPAETAPLGVAWHETALFRPLDPALSRRFGTAVALHGDTALVGATENQHGGSLDSAYVFRREGPAWSERARLVPSDAQPGDGFGAAVALAPDVAVVGAPRHATLGGQDGAVYVFERASADAPFLESLRLVPRDQKRNGLFGTSVALDRGDMRDVGANDATFLVVGAIGGGASPGDEPGHVFVFQRRARGHWLQVAAFAPPSTIGSHSGPHFGAAVAISGTTIVVGAPEFEADNQIPGRAFVYERAGATPHSWVQSALLAPADVRGRGDFGATVSIAGDALLIGSAIGAHAYERRGPGLPWSRPARIGPSEPTRVVVDENHAWLAGRSGTVRELVQASPGAAWSEVARFTTRPGPLAADRGTLLAGAPEEEPGAVHVFARGAQIDALAPDQAADEEEVVLRGLELDSLTSVRVDGVEQPILRRSATEIVLLPPRRDPGFADLELVAPQGTLVLPDGFESLPSLRVTPGGPGGTNHVRLANGTIGAYALLISFDLRSTPLQFSDPPTWYGLLLDMVPGRSGRLAVDAFDSSGLSERAYPVPNIAALAGLPIHLQAWCRRGLFGPGRFSFTNLASLTL